MWAARFAKMRRYYTVHPSVRPSLVFAHSKDNCASDKRKSGTNSPTRLVHFRQFEMSSARKICRFLPLNFGIL